MFYCEYWLVWCENILCKLKKCPNIPGIHVVSIYLSIYLSVCLINILSRSELVRISTVSALSFGGGGGGGGGILESSNPGSGRYEEKKNPSFICLSRGRFSAVSHRASARQTRTFAAVYLGVTRKPPHSARHPREFMNEKHPKQQRRGSFLTVYLRTWTKTYCLVQLV